MEQSFILQYLTPLAAYKEVRGHTHTHMTASLWANQKQPWPMLAVKSSSLVSSGLQSILGDTETCLAAVPPVATGQIESLAQHCVGSQLSRCPQVLAPPSCSLLVAAL